MSAKSELWFPAARISAILEGCDLAHHPNLTRRLYEMREGRQEYVSLRVVDELLLKLDLTHLLQLPLEQGGLADIYVDGKQYGAPDRKPKVKAVSVKRYATEEARSEALRRNWRESKRRARL